MFQHLLILICDLSYFTWGFLLGSCHCCESQPRGAGGGSDLPQPGPHPFCCSRAQSQWWVYAQTQASPEQRGVNLDLNISLSSYMSNSLWWCYGNQTHNSLLKTSSGLSSWCQLSWRKCSICSMVVTSSITSGNKTIKRIYAEKSKNEFVMNSRLISRSIKRINANYFDNLCNNFHNF